MQFHKQILFSGWHQRFSNMEQIGRSEICLWPGWNNNKYKFPLRFWIAISIFLLTLKCTISCHDFCATRGISRSYTRTWRKKEACVMQLSSVILDCGVRYLNRILGITWSCFIIVQEDNIGRPTRGLDNKACAKSFVCKSRAKTFSPEIRQVSGRWSEL